MSTSSINPGGKVEQGKNGYVRWPQLWGWSGAMMLAMSAMVTFIWSEHANHPHKGVVRQREYDAFITRYDKHMEHTRIAEREIQNRLIEIERRLPK